MRSCGEMVEWCGAGVFVSFPPGLSLSKEIVQCHSVLQGKSSLKVTRSRDWNSQARDLLWPPRGP